MANSIKYPNTKAGIELAQRRAGENGHWEEHVDWWANDTEDEDTQTERLVLKAIALAATDDPTQFPPEVIETVHRTLGNSTTAVSVEVCRTGEYL